MRLVFCHSAFLSKMPGFKGAWVIVDPEFDDYERVQGLLGEHATPLCTAQEFQRLVVECRDVFSGWVDVNLSPQLHIAQLLAPISRNPFSDFYRELMWILTVTSRLVKANTDILVVTRSSGVTKVLSLFAKERGIRIQRTGGIGFFLTAAARNLKSAIGFAHDLVNALCRMLISRIVLGKAYMARLTSIDVLLGTFLLLDDVSANGAVRHRYFPSLVDWYEQNNYRIAYYPCLIGVPIGKLISQYQGIRASKYQFVVPELFIRVTDIAGAAADCIKHAFSLFRLGTPKLLDVDMSALANSFSFRFAIRGMTTLLFLRTPERLANADVRPSWLLDWFENQPIDQATMLGFRNAEPSCRVIAVRPYALYSRNLLSYQVTNREVLGGMVPSEHWVGGKAWIDPSSTYDTISTYSVIPSLRNDYLHNIRLRETDGENLVVLLPYSLSDSVHILRRIAAAMPQLASLFSTVRIRAHPAISLNSLKRKAQRHSAVWRSDLIRWEPDMELTHLLSIARLVVSSGSSAALEAVVMGIPIVFIPSQQGIDMCPSEFIDERMYRIVFDDQQFTQVLHEWSPRHPLERRARLQIGRKLLYECFEPVTDNSMRLFHLTTAKSV
jgi:hypothetical protein